MPVPLRLLFVCVENSCRSQMAEGWARHHGGEGVVAESSGSRPSGVVNPKAIASMAEIDVDLSAHRSKGLDEIGTEPWDAVVTMGCGDACPHVPARRRLDWAIPDPKHMEPAAFGDVRDLVGRHVRELITELGSEASAEPGA